MDQVTAQTYTAIPDTTENRPLTERILEWLPGPRWVKVAIWIAVPVLRAVGMALVLELTGGNPLGWQLGLMLAVEALVFSYAVALAIWGVARIARDSSDLEPRLAELTSAGQAASPRIFGGMGNTTGPILLALVVTLALLVMVGNQAWWIILALLVLGVVIHLPLTTLFWAYLMLMLGLNRLGTRHLALEAYGGDKSLGLRPVGKLAFTGFWVFAATLAPILLISLTFVVSLVIGLLFFIAGVVAFFLSLWRVHDQMSRAKQRQLLRAQTLYQQAYEPLMTAHTLEILKERSGLLSAAEALEKRADAIQTWPFNDALLTRMVVIGLSVVTAIMARLVMKPLGL